jgi:hypothetical protein
MLPILQVEMADASCNDSIVFLDRFSFLGEGNFLDSRRSSGHGDDAPSAARRHLYKAPFTRVVHALKGPLNTEVVKNPGRLQGCVRSRMQDVVDVDRKSDVAVGV